MPTYTYIGPLSRGRVAGVAFTREVPVTVSETLAGRLAGDPHWTDGRAVTGVVQTGPGGGAVLPPFDPANPGPHWSDPALDPLDKAALLAFADDHDITVNRRLGAPKLRQVIADAIHANTNPDGHEPEPQEP